MPGSTFSVLSIIIPGVFVTDTSFLCLLQIPRQGHDGGEHRQRGGLAAEDAGAKTHRFCPGARGHFGLLGGKAALGAGHDGKAQLLPVGGLCISQQLAQGAPPHS